VATHERPRAPTPARLRRTGTGTLQRAARALPAAVRRAEHAGVQLHHAGAVLPRPAPSDAPLLPEAAGGDEPEEPAPPPRCRVDPARSHRRALRARARRRRGLWLGAGRASHRPATGAPRAAVQREDLLLAARRPARAQRRHRRHRARGAALSLPAPAAGGRPRPLPDRVAGLLVT